MYKADSWPACVRQATAASLTSDAGTTPDNGYVIIVRLRHVTSERAVFTFGSLRRHRHQRPEVVTSTVRRRTDGRIEYHRLGSWQPGNRTNGTGFTFPKTQVCPFPFGEPEAVTQPGPKLEVPPQSGDKKGAFRDKIGEGLPIKRGNPLWGRQGESVEFWAPQGSKAPKDNF